MFANIINMGIDAKKRNQVKKTESRDHPGLTEYLEKKTEAREKLNQEIKNRYIQIQKEDLQKKEEQKTKPPIRPKPVTTPLITIEEEGDEVIHYESLPKIEKKKKSFGRKCSGCVLGFIDCIFGV
ncbi:096L [Iridovirus CN01]|uniref:Uncharacterized protein n=2 Tax=Decapodiridovirus litopenaeus1 TaxID=3428192 RepID=A0A291B0P6_9VIRU|nr:hypothetical protein KM509_gp058 [Shrimp hemocyte iridescent virus]UPA43409.1 096L [Iridovirus CN01]ATE87067.1 hypothetical protein [Shrimp hemocyte iridescent virus]UPA43485.1 096L [Iridovirus CN01]UPA43681.1 096L [Iridovirus CN01]UPA43843.1 096L [Iridovirus CN01]